MDNGKDEGQVQMKTSQQEMKIASREMGAVIERKVNQMADVMRTALNQFCFPEGREQVVEDLEQKIEESVFVPKDALPPDLIGASVIINKYAQRIMYTLQIERINSAVGLTAHRAAAIDELHKNLIIVLDHLKMATENIQFLLE